MKRKNVIKLIITFIAFLLIYTSFTSNSKVIAYDVAGVNNMKANSQELLEDNAIYEIYFVSGTKVLDIPCSSKDNGANVTIYERGNQNNQKFRVKFNRDDGTYTFYNVNSGKVLDAMNGGTTNGANVCQYQYHGGDNQRWTVKKSSDGSSYLIISKAKGFYLDLYQGKNVNGQNIEIYQGHGGTSQRFRFQKVLTSTKSDTSLKDGVYKIYSQVGSNRLLGVPDSSLDNETQIKLSADNDLANQKFNVKYDKNSGAYVITALQSKKAMDVRANGGANGTLVQQYTKHGLASQQWIFIKQLDGTYSLISKTNGLALDVYGNSTAIGTTIQTYYYHGQKSQRFKFVPCEEKGTKSADDGTYRIFTKSNLNKCLDIAGGSKENGADLQIWDADKVDQQKFNIEYDGKGYYKIKAKHSGKVLTVKDVNSSTGKVYQVDQQEDENLDTQKWILKKCSENVYTIISKSKNLYLDVSDIKSTLETTGNLNNGKKLILKEETDLKPQQFVLVNETIPESEISTKLSDGVYQITTTGNKAIDIQDASYENAANILTWDNTRLQQQKFLVTKVPNTNYYKIISTHSAKSLDVSGGGIVPCSNVIQYKFSGTDNQYWYLKDCGNGYYNIISKKNGLYLDVQSGQVNTAGANIEIYYGNNANAQKFKFTPINIINDDTYEIESKLDSNKIVNIASSSQQEGGRAIIWEAENTDNARFMFSALSTDTYKIMAKHSNKVLTATKENTDVYQSTWNNSNSQKWQIRPEGYGYFSLINKETGKALDVYGNSTVNGNKIDVYNYHGGNCQQFRFVTGIRRFYEEGIYGYSGCKQIGDARGSNLRYYKFGKGPNVLFMTFSIHGFEDSYAHDGAELSYMAEEMRNYLYNNTNMTIAKNWTIYILPSLNPDGQVHGWTNNGPGRCTVVQGIDMNRNWSVGFKIDRSSRNYTGNSAFSAYETQALKNFMESHQGSTNITVDVHGWLNETIGDNGLGAYYRNWFGLRNGHIGSYGSGYLVNWARTLRNGRSVLVELPQVNNHSQTVAWQYPSKLYNATIEMLENMSSVRTMSINGANNIPVVNQFNTVFAGVVKNAMPTEGDIETTKLPTKTGIWIPEQSRDKFIDFLKQFSIVDFEIDEDGYLVDKTQIKVDDQDENLIKDNQEEQNSNKVIQTIRNAINSDKLFVINCSSTSYIKDEVTREIIEYPFERMDPNQAIDRYEKDNKVILNITENTNKKLTNEEILEDLILNLE